MHLVVLTGCAEKKINFLEKIAPQTIAARIQIPACAIAAVPTNIVYISFLLFFVTAHD
jgi:hypothetical protein